MQGSLARWWHTNNAMRKWILCLFLIRIAEAQPNFSGTYTQTVNQATGTNLHTVVDSGTVTTVGAVTGITNALPAGTNTLGSVKITDGTTVATIASAANLTAATGNGFLLADKGPRWIATQVPPAVSLRATASKAAGAAGVRHVVDCVFFEAGAITAPVATALTVDLRDGATGAGTVLKQWRLIVPANATQHITFDRCGLNLIGTAATAMTLEFSALLSNEFESVSITGFDVN